MKSDSNPDFAQLSTLPPTKYSYTTKIKDAAEYEFRVRSQNAAGQSEEVAELSCSLALQPLTAQGKRITVFVC